MSDPATRIAITRALVSVYDKTGLADLAKALHEAGVEIVSTGSTAAAITGAGIPVTSVESVTGFPECLGGRVKTLHPAVHGGLLADLRDAGHAGQLEQLGIKPFQLLVSSLYPFEQAIASGATGDDAIEQIDIGGPAMVRAAAKNHANIAVITSATAYDEVKSALLAGGFTLDQRRRLAAQAFARTASYDAAIASWFATTYAPEETAPEETAPEETAPEETAPEETAPEDDWPKVLTASWSRRQVLRYGENPHQRAALYTPASPAQASSGLAGAEQLHGKPMSYNNYVDADAAWRAAGEFTEPCAAIMKHSNPCGIALGTDIAHAHRKAHACDPVSAFGGVIAVNRQVTAELAAQIAEIFTEVIIAPGYDQAALEILTAKKNQRLLRCDPTSRAATRAPTRAATLAPTRAATEWRHISGGLLVQTADSAAEPGDRPDGWHLAAGPQATAETLADLEFAWRACRFVKSNAILLASDKASVGIGMGQVNRVDAARLSVSRAGDRAAGSVGASDAFFPFADGFSVLAAAGVRAIAEPGGSVRDAEVIEAATEAGVSLYFTGVRHFWH